MDSPVDGFSRVRMVCGMSLSMLSFALVMSCQKQATPDSGGGETGATDSESPMVYDSGDSEAGGAEHDSAIAHDSAGGQKWGDSGGSDSAGGSDVDWDSLNGTQPATGISAPEFAATNRDNTSRGREDLIGHPTVMWFYPYAGTSG